MREVGGGFFLDDKRGVVERESERAARGIDQADGRERSCVVEMEIEKTGFFGEFLSGQGIALFVELASEREFALKGFLRRGRKEEGVIPFFLKVSLVKELDDGFLVCTFEDERLPAVGEIGVGLRKWRKRGCRERRRGEAENFGGGKAGREVKSQDGEADCSEEGDKKAFHESSETF